jgi:hypothetical protein
VEEVEVSEIGKLAVSIASVFLGAYVFFCGWAWFLTPLGIPEIGVFHALGMATLISMSTTSTKVEDEVGDEEFFNYMVYRTVCQLVALLIMWLAQFGI